MQAIFTPRTKFTQFPGDESDCSFRFLQLLTGKPRHSNGIGVFLPSARLKASCSEGSSGWNARTLNVPQRLHCPCGGPCRVACILCMKRLLQKLLPVHKQTLIMLRPIQTVRTGLFAARSLFRENEILAKGPSQSSIARWGHMTLRLANHVGNPNLVPSRQLCTYSCELPRGVLGRTGVPNTLWQLLHPDVGERLGVVSLSPQVRRRAARWNRTGLTVGMTRHA